MDYHETNFKILQNKIMIEMIDYYTTTKYKHKYIQNGGGTQINTASNDQEDAIPLDQLLKPLIDRLSIIISKFETKLIDLSSAFVLKAQTKTEISYNKLIKKFFMDINPFYTTARLTGIKKCPVYDINNSLPDISIFPDISGILPTQLQTCRNETISYCFLNNTPSGNRPGKGNIVNSFIPDNICNLRM